VSTSSKLHWGAEGLWEQLVVLLPGISVEVLARVESTNTRLLERARAFSGDRDGPVTRPGDLDGLQAPERTPHGRRQGDIQPCLLVAEDQTRGRGRLGRDWVSEAGHSLTFSLSLPLAPAQWGGLSLAVGLALAEALDPRPLQAELAGPEHARPRIGLKWPNDLWLLDPPELSKASKPALGRKLGGILIETVSVGQQRMCVVGIGLNVRDQGSLAPEGLAHGYASLQELDPAITAPMALARVAAPLVQALLRFERQGFEPLMAAYRRRDLLRGQAVNTSVPEPLQGLADGVDEQGALLVRVGQGEQAVVKRVLSGEVSVRLSHV
jgi:BirA family transcriptional regulator, biotin operon repressor / biotin---[acetyl-CoA-carboxylase] ligase